MSYELFSYFKEISLNFKSPENFYPLIMSGSLESQDNQQFFLSLFHLYLHPGQSPPINVTVRKNQPSSYRFTLDWQIKERLNTSSLDFLDSSYIGVFLWRITINVINSLLNISHQNSKSYVTTLSVCSQCLSTSPTIRTQPFYFTDLSKLN